MEQVVGLVHITSTMQTQVPQSGPEAGVYLAAIEERLAKQLHEVSREVDRAEFFDDEQRAEVYAILEALHSDGRAHRQAISLISRTPETGDA